MAQMYGTKNTGLTGFVWINADPVDGEAADRTSRHHRSRCKGDRKEAVLSELDDPRVLLAAERTLLAWSRTSVALIGLGFLVERSSLLKPDRAPSDSAPMLLSATFVIGLGFIVLGVLTVVLSSLQYRRVLKTLTAAEIPEGYNAKSGFFLNALVGFLGLALGLALLFDQG